MLADTLLENCCVDFASLCKLQGEVCAMDHAPQGHTQQKCVMEGGSEGAPVSALMVAATLLGNAALSSGIFTPNKLGSPSSCWVRGEQVQLTQKSLKLSKDLFLDLIIKHLLLCWCLSQ